MSEDQLIRLVKKAYKRTALIPSRGVWGISPNERYGSATGALIEAFGEFPQTASPDWISGFDLGFEQHYCSQQQIEMLTFGSPKDFAKGFLFGLAVGTAIFQWDDAPDIHSKPE